MRPFNYYKPIKKYLSSDSNLIKVCQKNDKNLSAILYGKNDLRLENRPIKEPKSNQVLLRMESVGICGSDVKYLTEGKISNFIVKKSMVIGHEGSGTVIKTGRDVKNLKIGDRVAIEPGIPCRICKMCKEGRYNLCPNIYFCATPPDDGNLQRFYVHDEDFCFKLPDNMSFDEGATVEPLSCACRCMQRGNVKFGSKVLVLGAGPIGLMTVGAAKANRSKVLVTDIHDYRLKIAQKMGADEILNVKGLDEKAIIEAVQSKLKCRPSVTIECSGDESSVRLGMSVTRIGGKFVIISCGANEMKLPLMPTVINEIDILGVFRYCNDYPTAIRLIHEKLVDPNPMITHHFKIDDSLEAFETHKSGKGNPIKIMIHPNAEWKPELKKLDKK